jgi:hypothetical protein
MEIPTAGGWVVATLGKMTRFKEKFLCAWSPVTRGSAQSAGSGSDCLRISALPSLEPGADLGQ